MTGAPSTWRTVFRGLLLSAGAGTVAVLTARLAMHSYPPLAHAAQVDPADATGLLACVVAALISLWLAALLAAATLAALPVRSSRFAGWVVRRLAPLLVRQLATLVLGGTLLTTPGTATSMLWLGTSMSAMAALPVPKPAHPAVGAHPVLAGVPTTTATATTATTSTRPTVSSPTNSPRTDLTGSAGAPSTASRRTDCVPLPGWSPIRPATPRVRADCAVLVASRADTRHAAQDHLVVRRGDTLWDIAARHLGPDATAAQIACEWPRWWRANHTVIGSDPDLLMPGQLLNPPPPVGAS